MILKALMEYETVENNLTRQGVVRRLRVSHGTLHRYCLPWLTDCHQALAHYVRQISSLFRIVQLRNKLATSYQSLCLFYKIMI